MGKIGTDMKVFLLDDTVSLLPILILFASLAVVTFLICKYVLKLPEKLERYSEEQLKLKYKRLIAVVLS